MKRFCQLFCGVLLAISLFSTVSARESTPAPTLETSVAPQFAMAAEDEYPKGFFEDVQVEPGQSVTLAVRIWNSGTVPVELRTFKVNAMTGINGGYVPGAENDNPLSHTEWLDYRTQSISLDPGESQEVSFTVSVPPKTPPGQYISGLMVQTAEPLSIDGTDSLDQVLGYTITVGILVPGELDYSFQIEESQLEVNKTGRSIYVPVTNSGNFLVRPEGSLEITNAAGDVVVSTPIEMGSIYAGLTAPIQIHLPEQLQPGDYQVNVSLSDKDSGATHPAKSTSIEVPAPIDPSGISVTGAAIEPNAEEIVFANVDVTLNNGGQQIPASNVTLEVMRDGEQVESFPLATNQVLLSGENQFTTRYIPADMWESGTYTFNIVVSAVDPNGGQQTILLDEELDATIVVP